MTDTAIDSDDPFAQLREVFAGRRALLLEDDPALAEHVAGRLVAAGFEAVDRFDAGEGALEAANARPYDILILDRRMDFWEALEASRKASTKHWLGLFFFSSVVFLLNLVAFLATLSLGLIVTIPFTCCVMVEAYAEIFGVRGGRPGKTFPPDAGLGEAPATVLAG